MAKALLGYLEGISGNKKYYGTSRKLFMKEPNIDQAGIVSLMEKRYL